MPLLTSLAFSEDVAASSMLLFEFSIRTLAISEDLAVEFSKEQGVVVLTSTFFGSQSWNEHTIELSEYLCL